MHSFNYAECFETKGKTERQFKLIFKEGALPIQIIGDRKMRFIFEILAADFWSLAHPGYFAAQELINRYSNFFTNAFGEI